MDIFQNVTATLAPDQLTELIKKVVENEAKREVVSVEFVLDTRWVGHYMDERQVQEFGGAKVKFGKPFKIEGEF